MIQVKAMRGVHHTKIILHSVAPRICRLEVTPKTVCLKFRRTDLENVIFDGENVIFDGEQVVK